MADPRREVEFYSFINLLRCLASPLGGITSYKNIAIALAAAFLKIHK